MTNMNEQEIRKLIPELVWKEVDGRNYSPGHDEHIALDYELGDKRVYYRIVHYAQYQEGVYHISKMSVDTPYVGYSSWVIKANSLEEAKQRAQEHRAKVICQMLRATPSSDQPEKPAEASQTINVRELLEQELYRLADEANRGEWDTLPNEMKYFKRKKYDTLLSYIALQDLLEECEAKNSELKRRNEL